MGHPDRHDTPERVEEAKPDLVEIKFETAPVYVDPRLKTNWGLLIVSMSLVICFPAIIFAGTFLIASLTGNLFVGYYGAMALGFIAPFLGALAIRRLIWRALYFVVSGGAIFLWIWFGAGNIFS